MYRCACNCIPIEFKQNASVESRNIEFKEKASVDSINIALVPSYNLSTPYPFS